MIRPLPFSSRAAAPRLAFDTVAEVLRRADQDGILPHVAADLIAGARIAAAAR